ncbi:MAG: polyprenyl synthetase family protein, partial [Puniceicoccales bacterium]|nr:polyprenyl synthetase family protein [Puniceicoccales bacterium]
MAFSDQLERHRKGIESALDRWIPSVHPSRLHEAMRYSLFSGGKRLRPLWVVAVSEWLGTSMDPYPAAASVECLHTYSLIHDDLPCCDNSDWRRHRPSCHRKFGELTALLAGDALLAQAFYILSQGYAAHPIVATTCTQILSFASGSTQLVGGQMEDTLPTLPRRQHLNQVNLKKTTALLRACFEMAGCLS